MLGRMSEVAIRRATPRDGRAVKDICRRIWGEGDYLPEVFAAWVRDRRGGMWVASIDDRVVGIAKLSLVGDHEAWLHALRVDPRYQRRGVATALVARRLERAKQLGARVARLDTSEDNVAVRRLMRHFGFRRAGRYTFWRMPARGGAIPRRAAASELAAVERLARRAGDGILHEERVRRQLGHEDLARAVRRGDCVVVGPPGRPQALALVEGTTSPAGARKGPALDRLRVRYLAGKGRGLRNLLVTLPAEARRRGLPRVGMSAAVRHWPALRRARYRRHWSDAMLVFEKAT